MRLTWCALPLAGSLGLMVPALAAAQAAPAPRDSAAARAEARDPYQIVVNGGRFEGEITPPQKAIATLEQADIASYGANNLTDLIDLLSTDVGSGRGRGGGMPVILVNGARISSFRELRNYPPEAVARIQVFPEEVALAYGYPPDQRVVNIVLKPHYSSKSADGSVRAPDRGGTETVKRELSTLRIAGRARFNLALTADHTSPLTQAERNVIQQPGSISSVPGDPGQAANRTLVADATDFGGNLTGTLPFGQGAQGGNVTLNFAPSHAVSTSYQGLPTVLLTAPGGATALRTLAYPLAQRNRSDSLQGGGALNKTLGDWRLSATLDASHAYAVTLSALRPDTSALILAAAAGSLPVGGGLGPVPDAGFARAVTISNSVTSLATLVGHPLQLPGGKLDFTLKAGFAYSNSKSLDSRQFGAPLDLKRGAGSLGANISIPIASRREHVLDAIGDLTLNLSGGFDRLSDYGTLGNWSAGLSWEPSDPLSISASYIVSQAAPSLSQLGAPVVQSFSRSIYDFTTGQSVLVTITSGGNPALARQTQRDLKLSLNWDLPFVPNAKLVVDYFDNRSANVSAGFPLLTPAIEAAFGARVVRDPSGRLVSIDARPVTFASQRQTRMRFGFNVSGKIGKPTAPTGERGGPNRLLRLMGGGGPGGGAGGGEGGGPGGPGGNRERGGGAGDGFGGRGGGGRGGGFGAAGQGRWNIALFDTVEFIDRVTVAPGGPVLNLLGGDALSGGGVARHAVQLDAGGFYRGFGLRLSGTYSNATHVRGSGLPGSTDLRFGALTKLNARLFVDLGQQARLTRAVPFLKGARLSLLASNLFDSRQKVTDQSGAVPLAYQPDLIDPQGRVLGLEFRKLF